MIFVANPHELAAALKKLLPSRGRYRSLAEPLVMADARLNTVTLRGTLDSSASIEAQVFVDGSSPIPLAATINVLKTYKKTAKVTIHAQPGALLIDRLRLPLPGADTR